MVAVGLRNGPDIPTVAFYNLLLVQHLMSLFYEIPLNTFR